MVYMSFLLYTVSNQTDIRLQFAKTLTDCVTLVHHLKKIGGGGGGGGGGSVWGGGGGGVMGCSGLLSSLNHLNIWLRVTMMKNWTLYIMETMKMV